jgi:hypothetical protein
VTTPNTDQQLPGDWYEIRLRGRLAPRWVAWFDGLTLTTDDDGTTTLRGRVVDQAALYGVLQRLRDLGVPLVSVVQVPPDTDGSDDRSLPDTPAHPIRSDPGEPT